MSLLASATQTAPGVPLFAPASGGGGGGGGGPNPDVSTITFSNATQLSGFAYTTNDGNQNPGVLVGSAIDANARQLYAGTIALQGFGNAGGETYATLTGGSAGDPYNAGAATLIADCRGLYIEDSRPGEAGKLFVSSINCSTINGAAPGGGGGVSDNPIVSTISFNGGAQGSDIIFPASYTGQQTSDTFIIRRASAGTNNTIILDPVGAQTTNSQAGIVLTSGTGPGQLELTILSSATVYANQGLDITSTYINLNAPTSVSSLTVSSINGAAPGGGGGSVGPNPSFSSINFPATASLNMDGTTGPTQLIISNPTSPGNPDMSFFTAQNANAIVTNYQPGGQANIISMNPPSGVATALNLATTDSGSAAIAAVNLSGNPSTLVMSADNIKIIEPVAGGASLDIYGDDTNLYTFGVNRGSTIYMQIGLTGGRNQFYTPVGQVDALYVSTINGAAPGGSVGPNLTVSTITGQAGVNGADTSFILRQASDGSGRTQLAYNTTDKKGFGTYPFNVTNTPSGLDMGNLCCALDSNANPAGFGIGGNGVPGALVFNDPTGTNDDWIVGGGGGFTHYASNAILFSTIAVNIPTTLNASNVNVSSINGAAYPPTSVGSIQKINWLSNSYTLSPSMTPGAASTLTTTSANLTNGHTYRVTAAFGASNTAATGITALTIEGSWGGLPALIYQTPNQFISSSVGQPAAGYVGYFTTAGGSGGISVGGTNTGSAASYITGDNAYVLVEDLGAF